MPASIARMAAAAALACCAACVPQVEPPPAQNPPPEPVTVVQPVAAPRPIEVPSPPPAPAGPSTFVFDGALEQGGWLRGQAPAGTVAARLGDQALDLDGEGRFFAGLDRDAGATATLTATLADGSTIESPVAVAPRAWQIEHVNIARSSGGPSAEFMKRRTPELVAINAARNAESDADGWRQDFIWPVTGRISGRFGSQRIYRGEPGSYHSGLDIATGSSGTPYVAPADGVVTLVASPPFSLEGNLVIIDHGDGLNSAFLHSSEVVVKEGQRVKQGQMIGRIGATGRATGPHLHWSIKWRDARLDPLLLLGPMP